MRTSRAMSLSSLPVFGARDADKPPDLTDFLDADPRPTFLVPIGPGSSMQFKLSLWNQAFLGADVRTDILDETPAAMQFRSWCQAVVHWRQVYEFAGRTWTAFKIQHRWKCIQESKAIGGCTHDLHAADPHTDLTEGELSMLEDHVHADARLASLYKMMEMSDVGTFEYNPQGTLLRANDSWYRLSLHPKGDLPSDFSFMDLVYPPDGPMVLAHWNKLVQGIPVTFEMRWKGKNYRDAETGDGIEDAQWVLSACVPIHDASGNVVSIAGNTIDINAQKRVQEEALQRAEALERARESERKFKSFALLAPIAIYISDSCGMITYCNNRFFELTGHPPVTDFRDIDCSTLVYQEDQPILEDQWKTLLQDKHHTKAHFRLQNTWDLGDGTLRQAWAESQAFPELDDEGNVSSVFGTMTDISRFKWAEEIQRTRMEEALEAKRKHENFIDMTSHEMRNPLSAVIQCADSSIDTLKTVLSLKSKLVFPEAKLSKHIDKEIKLCLDSMNTIISCSIHQKRVIDDVLTLSKMDSNLLAITPVRVEPVVIVADAVHMFQLECVKDGIRMIFSEDPSLRSIGAQHVMLDPSRVLQILMNFITNAIKFTRDCPIRQIEVKLGACSSRPSQGFLGIPYAKVATDASNLLNGEEWGNGHVVYIWISCRDTGCGMTVEEQSNLFTRFSQATPRTHIRYGGSGLGLFISKKLAELQAGAIGVRSEPAVGSTFAFFVAARLAPPPTPLKDSEPGEFPMLGRRASLGSNGGSPLKPPPKYTVLIVEDNLVNQKVLSLQLRRVGCQVFLSNHGAEALDFLQRTADWVSPPGSGSNPNTQPNGGTAVETGMITSTGTSVPIEAKPTTADTARPAIQLSVILMDIEMPVMDGLTCARRIRAFQEAGYLARHIPIMAVSANARSEQVAQARDAGMDDTISKPFRIAELLPKIEALMQQGEGPLFPVARSSGPKVAAGTAPAPEAKPTATAANGLASNT